MELAPDVRREEVALKAGHVRALMIEEGLDAVVLTTQASVAWIGAGLTDRVLRDRQEGLVWGVVTHQGVDLIAWDTEQVRLETEESILDLGFRPHYVSWPADDRTTIVRDLAPVGRVGSDVPGWDVDCSVEIRLLRSHLLDDECRRLGVLSAHATAALEEVLREVRPGVTERELAGGIAGRLEATGATPLVLLVGTGDRLAAFRHWVPTGEPIDRAVVATLAAECRGLVTVVTRTVWFGVDDETRVRQDRVMTVAAAAAAATQVGASWGSALEEAAATYDALGHPGEWRRHFQGGAVGYDTREFSPGPSREPNLWSRHLISAGQAFAWNPTLPGVKSEDTYLVSPDGPELLTCTEAWPTVPIDCHDIVVEVPDVLVI
ncbi:MAG: M24 family metallopeptidase [Actinomycetales bacterium]|nr:M24 family metallopeptidase [Actinomycetales bacterium]